MPAGPLTGQKFAPGACLLTSGRSSDGLTIIVWDHAQAGLPWMSGEVTDRAPEYVESALGDEGEAQGLLGRARDAGSGTETASQHGLLASVAG